MEIANERYAGESPLSESPNEAVSLIIGDNTVSTPKLQDNAVTTPKINNKAVTPEKLSDEVTSQVIRPIVNQAKQELNVSIQNLADKEARDIANVQQDYSNRISNLNTTLGSEINNLRNDVNRKYNALNTKIDNAVVSINAQTDAKIAAVENKCSKNFNNLQKQIIDNKKEYNRNRTEDQKGIKEQLRALRDKDNDLQNQIDSLEIAGLALSQMFGEDTHIGISQRTLTYVIGRIWEILGEIKHKDYMDFTLTVEPAYTYQEGDVPVTITADCTEGISYFDSIKIYVDDVLVDEATGINFLTTVATISQTANIKAVGVIVGKTIEKEAEVIKEIPFFIGSALEDYQDVMIPANWKEIEGSLQGDYDFTVNNNGEHIFVILPISRQEEFRRCRLDMNGFEIPFDITETSELIICKSQNTYNQGEYNIDIDINN